MLDQRRTCPTAQLFRDFGPQVGRWAARLAPRSEADDIVQEVFLAVHRQRAAAGSLHSAPAWLFQITRNVVRHAWRTRARTQGREQTHDLDRLASPDRDPLAELERRRAAADLDGALARLSEDQRNIYWLLEVRGLSANDVAALTGSTPQTVRVRHFRIRRALARSLARTRAAG